MVKTNKHTNNKKANGIISPLFAASIFSFLLNTDE